MHPWLLAAALGVAGPSATEPAVELGDAAEGEAVGVVWHDQATVAPALQQRLVDALGRRAALPGEAVIPDAVALARARVALTLPRSRVEQHGQWRAMLDEASAAYRTGQLASARALVRELVDAVRADPVVPGAAALAWRSQVLRAQLAWAEGDAVELEQALAAAVALDPEATPSTRQVPPPVVEAYARHQQAVLAETSRWPSVRISGAADVPLAVEIDGVPGQRPVPPGEHLVVVRRPGRPPVGAVVSTEAPWVVPDEPPRVMPGLPRDREAAQRICDETEATWLVLARVRDDRLGLQRFSCGQGFGPAWFEARDGWASGLDHVSAAIGGVQARPVLHGEEPWPAVPEPPRALPVVLADGPPPSPRARLRRVLPWMLIGGAIAGAVTVGVLFGGEPSPDLAIDGKGFLRP